MPLKNDLAVQGYTSSIAHSTVNCVNVSHVTIRNSKETLLVNITSTFSSIAKGEGPSKSISPTKKASCSYRVSPMDIFMHEMNVYIFLTAL